MPLPVTRVTPPSGPARLELAEPVEYRELIAFLIWRDIKVRYKQTTLGVAWAVAAAAPHDDRLHGGLRAARAAAVRRRAVSVFTLAGAAAVAVVLRRRVSGSANSLVGSASLITKVYFPRLIVPLAAVLATLVDFAMSFVVLLALMVYYRHRADGRRHLPAAVHAARAGGLARRRAVVLGAERPVPRRAVRAAVRDAGLAVRVARRVLGVARQVAGRAIGSASTRWPA